VQYWKSRHLIKSAGCRTYTGGQESATVWQRSVSKQAWRRLCRQRCCKDGPWTCHTARLQA